MDENQHNSRVGLCIENSRAYINGVATDDHRVFFDFECCHGNGTRGPKLLNGISSSSWNCSAPPRILPHCGTDIARDRSRSMPAGTRTSWINVAALPGGRDNASRAQALLRGRTAVSQLPAAFSEKTR